MMSTYHEDYMSQETEKQFIIAELKAVKELGIRMNFEFRSVFGATTFGRDIAIDTIAGLKKMHPNKTFTLIEII